MRWGLSVTSNRSLNLNWLQAKSKMGRGREGRRRGGRRREEEEERRKGMSKGRKEKSVAGVQ